MKNWIGTTRLLHITIASCALTACTSSTSTPPLGPETDPTTTQQDAITSMQTSLTELTTVDVQGSDAAGAALLFSLDSTELFTTSQTLARAPTKAIVANAIARPSRFSPDVSPAGCEVDAASSITWNNCTDQDATIDGMISWSPGHVTMDIHVTGTSGSVSIDYHLSGSMTVSDTAINGDLKLALSVTEPGASATANLETQIDVQLTGGCITSGTLTATEMASGTNSQGMQENVDAAVQIVWTGCNMVRVRNSQ